MSRIRADRSARCRIGGHRGVIVGLATDIGIRHWLPLSVPTVGIGARRLYREVRCIVAAACRLSLLYGARLAQGRSLNLSS